MERAELTRLLGASPRRGRSRRPPAIVCARDPARFQAEFAAAVASGGAVFLADPAWGAAERSELERLAGSAAAAGEEGWLMIPSGGTTGRVKFARHDGKTIAAAVDGFRRHVGAGRVNAVGVLPLHHVSGLMAWMRAALSGGTHLAWDWKRLEAGERPRRPRGRGPWFLSLVPTQLQRLMGSARARDWLGSFEAVFLGGGPLWPELAEEAARARLPLSPSFGMTETAAMVAALPPAEFLAGDHRSSGTPLPHARLALAEDGRLRIAAGSLFRGYYPGWRSEPDFLAEDRASIDGRGRLHLLGRSDAVIITGGKKVDPAEVEEALRSCGEFADVAVVGAADREWGRAVIACYPAGEPRPDLGRAREALQRLAAHKRPRRYVPVEEWPRNAQGKLNRAELERRIAGGAA